MFTNRYAYLLGVQEYQDAKIPKLSTPANDITTGWSRYWRPISLR